MVAGLPGRMARVAALGLRDRHGVELLPQGLSSAARAGSRDESVGLDLVGPPTGGAGQAALAQTRKLEGLVVDYTTPAAATANALAYTKAGVPFVMGTTGLDLAAVRAAVAEAGIPAVAAPNMAVPLVLYMAALRFLAAEFPGALAGLPFAITESHQSTKKDVSGTAKAVAPLLAQLGAKARGAAESPGDGIVSVRDPQQQTALGIPAEHLAGHAFHDYKIGSRIEGFEFAIQHTVLGREVYVAGTAAALRFVASRQSEWKSSGRFGRRGEGALYTMEDVLRGAGQA